MLSKLELYASAQSLKRAENRLFFTNKVGKSSRNFVGVFNKTVIPLALVRYEIIIANSVLRASLAIHHLISVQRALVQ